MMADGRLRHGGRTHEVADTSLHIRSAVEDAKEPETGRLREDSQPRCQQISIG